MSAQDGVDSTFDSTEVDEVGSIGPGLHTRRGRFVWNGQIIYPIHAWLGSITGGEEWKHRIDSLADLQMESVRFRFRVNPWDFCWNSEELSPWVATDGKTKLEGFNQAFWQALRRAAEYADSRGALIQVVLFDAESLRPGRGGTGWFRNPFNAHNGGPISSMEPTGFYTLAAPHQYGIRSAGPPVNAADSVLSQYHQEELLRTAVEALAGLPNVSWQIVSGMDGSDPVRVGFVSHMVEALRNLDPLDRLVSLSGSGPRKTDAVFYRLRGIDSIDFRRNGSEQEPHWELAETVAGLTTYGKPVVNCQTDWPADDEQAGKLRRWSLWQTFVAGGHPYAEPPESDSERIALKTFCEFAAATDLLELTQVPQLVKQVPDGSHALSALSTKTALVYLTVGTPIAGGTLNITLPRGSWQATIVAPATAVLADIGSIEASGKAASLHLPPFAEDLVVRFDQVD